MMTCFTCFIRRWKTQLAMIAAIEVVVALYFTALLFIWCPCFPIRIGTLLLMMCVHPSIGTHTLTVTQQCVSMWMCVRILLRKSVWVYFSSEKNLVSCLFSYCVYFRMTLTSCWDAAQMFKADAQRCDLSLKSVGRLLLVGKTPCSQRRWNKVLDGFD